MQALSDITAQLFDRAGITRGLRILDVGCGSGEVTRALAERVGPEGRVVGLDASPSAIETARSAAQQAGLTNVDFVVRALPDLGLDAGSFDCVVGRRVLMYLPDAQEVLTGLAGLLRVGGRMAFQEHDATMTPGRTGDWPLHDQVHHWMWETVRREGGNPSLGLALAPMIHATGLAVQALWAQAIFSGYERDVHRPLHEILGVMVPRIVALGVATAEQIDLPTLRYRLEEERRRHATTYISDLAVCVVATRLM